MNLKKAISLWALCFFLTLSLSGVLYSQVDSSDCKRQRLIEVAKGEVGVTKQKHMGRVLGYLNSVGIKRYASYCAAFVRWCLDSAKINFPVRSAMAQSYIRKNSIKASDVLAGRFEIPPGWLVCWKRGGTGLGHLGINTEKWKGKSGKTVEGNTSDNDTRTGGAVQAKTRTIEPYNYLRITHFTPVN